MQLRLVSQPKLFMHPVRSRGVFACEEYLFEPLLRGRRCILHSERITQTTHGDNTWPQDLPWQPADFKDFRLLSLDGVYDEARQSYFAFDLLQVNHMHLIHEPLLNRKIMLQQVTEHLKHIQVVDYVIHHGKEYYERLRSRPLCSGMIAKQLESDYIAAVESPNWIRMDFSLT